MSPNGKITGFERTRILAFLKEVQRQIALCAIDAPETLQVCDIVTQFERISERVHVSLEGLNKAVGDIQAMEQIDD